MVRAYGKGKVRIRVGSGFNLKNFHEMYLSKICFYQFDNIFRGIEKHLENVENFNRYKNCGTYDRF